MRAHYGLGLFIGIVATFAIAQPGSTSGNTDDGLSAYRLEHGDLNYVDIVTLGNGSKLQGKALEWADHVLIHDAAGNVKSIDTAYVEKVDFRRGARHTDRPKLPDLTVAYVERLPRDLSWQGHISLEGGVPKPDITIDPATMKLVDGAKATFRVHVLNAGAVKSEPVAWSVSIAGEKIGNGTLNAIEPNAEQVIEASWAWKSGSQCLRVDIDAEAKQKESLRWNNAFEEMTDAQSVAIVVARDRYESFREHPNMVDSFCFEDWAQYQLRCMNGLFRASVYPTSPDGIRERLRCDRIMIVDDPTNPATRDSWALSLRRGGKADAPAEEAALMVWGPLGNGALPRYDNLRVDWPALKKLGIELGLVDFRATDTQPNDCQLVDQFERYVIRQHLYPMPRTFMHTPGGVRLDELSTAYLNDAKGKPRGYRGEMLYRLPEKITICVRSNTGKPLEGIQVDAFQLQSEGEYAGQIAGTGRDPLYSANTNTEGRLELPSLDAPNLQSPNGFTLRPNPFGRISTDGRNGLLLFRLRHVVENATREEFHFVRLVDCCLAAFRSPGKSHEIVMETRFADPDMPPAPPYTLIVMEDRSSPTAGVKLRWKTPMSLLTVEEFRVYRKRGFGGEEATPWTLTQCLRKNGKRWTPEVEEAGLTTAWLPGEYTPDTFFALTTVDKQGRESGLSNTAYMAWDKQCEKFAIDTDAAFMTLSGPGPVQMLRWDAIAGTQPFAVKTGAFRGYKPGFGGIAISPEHRVVVSDPINHVIATYDLNGNLEDIMPRRAYWPGFPSDDPGEFYDPVDIAVDKAGRMYITDRGNNRIQILDAQGRFVSMLDPEFKFIGPHAAACSNNRICITDKAGSRVRIYQRDGDKIALERELPAISGGDRFIVSTTGKIYGTGYDPVSKENRVLVFTAEGNSARMEPSLLLGEMGNVYDPHSAYLYDYLADNYLYVVNKFPFDVRRFKMD